jgi:Thioredoxin-like domain
VRVRPAARVALVGIAWVLCTGPAAADEPSPPATGALQPVITTSELVVGRNRFAFGLLKDGSLLTDRRVAVRLYDVSESDAKLVAVTPAVYQPLEVIEGGRHIHVHPDGARHVHGTATDVHGIYVAHLTLERPGPWGLEIVVHEAQGSAEAARLSVTALARPHAPMPGTAAPRSRNLIASDVSDLRQIDSSEPPDPRLHQTRIADAIRQRRPQLIVFATPKYCTSRVCGPVLDVVRTLIPAYGDRVAFVHEEIWQAGDTQRLSATVEEWNLRSEPWIFVVDGDGVIRARFEGLTTRRELETALRQTLRLP